MSHNIQVQEEISQGHGLTLSELARRLPSSRQGKPVTLSCLIRWVSKGVRNASGQRVRLEAARCAGKWLSTPQALQRFLAAQTPTTTAKTDSKLIRTPSQRQRAGERAAHELEKVGI